MNQDDKSRKVVGIYDRPARADRRRGGAWRWAALVVLLVLLVLAWVLVFGTWPLTQPPT